jgi:hypothetical protein
MGLNDSFEYLKHELWPKEGSEVKIPIWLLIIKSQELPWFTCTQLAWHIILERLRQGLQFCFKSHPNRRSAQKIMSLQSRRSPNFGKFGTKWHLGATPMAKHSSNTPLLSPKCCKLRSLSPHLLFLLFSPSNSHLSLMTSLGVRQASHSSHLFCGLLVVFQLTFHPWIYDNPSLSFFVSFIQPHGNMFIHHYE